MSFKIWGKEGVMNKSELQTVFTQLGISDSFSLFKDLMNKGCVKVGQTKVFLLK